MNASPLALYKRSRWCRRATWTAAALLCYTLLGFFAAPALLKWQLLKQLPAATKRNVAVRQVKMNPWTLSLTIRGLELTEPDGRPFASWDELYINLQTSSLFRWAWTFKEIRLVRPFGELILFKNGQLNFANMFASATNSPPKAPSAGIPRINIYHLEITNGFVAAEDRTRRSVFRTEYRPINLNLTNFTTRANAEAPYSFRAESDAGRSVTWAGDVSMQPVRSAGHLEVTGVKLSRYQPYLEDFTRALLTNGIADIQLNYVFEAGTNGLDLAVTNAGLHVERVELNDPDTGEQVAGVKGFDVQQAGLNYRERTAWIGTITISEATFLSRLQKNGHLNLLDLVTLPLPGTNAAPAKPAQDAAAAPWNLTVEQLNVQKAGLAFEDQLRRSPFKTELSPVEFTLKHFSTRENCDAEYMFRLTSELAETIEGAGIVSIKPPRSSGEVRVGSVDVKKYLPYAEQFFRGRILEGKFNAQVPYACTLVTNCLHAGVSNLAVTLTGLKVQLPEAEETIASLDEFGVSQVEAGLDLLLAPEKDHSQAAQASAPMRDQHARVGLIKAKGGSLLLRRQKDGSINLLGLLPAAPAGAIGSSNAVAVAVASQETSITNSGTAPLFALGGWTAHLDELALEDYTLRVEDLQPAKPASFLLDQVGFNLKNLNSASNTPVQVALGLRFNETGRVDARGVVELAPRAATVQLAITNLDLRAFQSYLEQQVRLNLVRGNLGVNGKAQYQTTQPSAPQLTFNGEVRVTDFASTDQTLFKDFVRWDALALEGIDLGLQPNHLKVEQLKWVQPRASMRIGADHKPNLSLVLKEVPPTNAPAAPSVTPVGAAASAPAANMPIELGTLALERAAFAFSDESIQPNASVNVKDLTGTVKGLSSALNTTAAVDLHGTIEEQSPFSIVGRANPFATNLFVDMVVSNANTQLTPLTGYLEKYAGHPLNKGRLSTTLHYQVQGKELKAENKLQVDQLTLGPRNNSPDATSLPVKLGVALLKDANGRIELDVPVSGRLDDPQFSIAPIVLKVIVNTLVKAATSPFKLLGALAGGGGDELSFVQFAPGTTNALEGEVDKLQKLAVALAKRPSLNLEIEGAVDPVSDRQALGTQKVREELKAARLWELSAKRKAPQSIDTFQLEPEEYDRLLRLAFAEQFGTNVAAILRTNELALASTNQTPAATSAKSKPSPPLYRRAIDFFVSVAKSFHKTPAEKRLTKADRLALKEATPAVMESLLAGKASITDEDFRALMSARSAWAQDWLLQNGHIGADRVFIVAPKAVDGAYKGASQVNLSVN